MTSPIKPTKGPANSSVDATRASDVSQADKIGKTDKAFGSEMESARASKASQAAPVDGAWAALAQDVKAGKLSREQLIEHLVDKQLSSPSAKALPAAERVRLESALRDALANDPTLVTLLADAGASR